MTKSASIKALLSGLTPTKLRFRRPKGQIML